MPSPGSYAQIDTRDDGGKLSTPSLIGIVVACACVALLALALFLWRFISRCLQPRRSNPLPPVQELAHHREQQLAVFSERYASSNLSGMETPPSVWAGKRVSQAGSGTGTGSAVSLIPGTLESKGNLYSESPTATVESFSPSYFPSPSSTPTPASGSILSPASLENINSARPQSQGSLTSPLSSVPASTSSGSSSPANYDTSTSINTVTTGTGSGTNSPRNSLLPPARPQRTHSPSPLSSPSNSHSRSRSRSRPLSVVSSAGTTHSVAATLRTVRSSIRGAPHLPHNRESIQIVLPAPLGVEKHAVSRSGGRAEVNASGSMMVDRWIHHSRFDASELTTSEGRRNTMKETSRRRSTDRKGKLHQRTASYTDSPLSSDSDPSDRLSIPLSSSMSTTPPSQLQQRQSRPPRQPPPSSYTPPPRSQDPSQTDLTVNSPSSA